MSVFTNWAAAQFKKDAEVMEHTPQLIKCLREESDEQWVQRVMPIMDQLLMTFVLQTGRGLCVHSMEKEAVLIFNKLKEQLTPDIPKSPNPPVKT